VLAASIARLRGALRPGDMLFPMEDGSLAVTLAATPRLDAEIMVRIAARLQLVVQQPLSLADGPAQLTCSIGFCHAASCANQPDARFWTRRRWPGTKPPGTGRGRSAAIRTNWPAPGRP
jgi:diguanylate cyclase